MAKQENGRYFDGYVDFLVGMPAWVGPAHAVAAWLMIRFGSSFVMSKWDAPAVLSAFYHGFAPVFSWCASVLILLAWGYAELVKFVDRQHLNRRPGIGNADQMLRIQRKDNGLKFEYLLAEAYQQKGYAAKVVSGDEGYDGADIRLTCADKLVLVQSKYWRAATVRPSAVHKLLSVMKNLNADGGILVTSGSFTHKAMLLARDNHIELTDGRALTALIDGVLGARRTLQQAQAHGESEKTQANPINQQQDTAPMCPECGLPMVLCTAKKSVLLGRRFWGCPRYPDCRAIIPYNLAQRLVSEKSNQQ